MKLAFFEDFRLGIVRGEAIVDVSDILARLGVKRPQAALNLLIEEFPAWRPELEAAANRRTAVPLDSVRLCPPIPERANIVCMAICSLPAQTTAVSMPFRMGILLSLNAKASGGCRSPSTIP